ncbi:hypothetical protein [Amycolatopsis sp. NPDC004378]
MLVDEIAVEFRRREPGGERPGPADEPHDQVQVGEVPAIAIAAMVGHNKPQSGQKSFLESKNDIQAPVDWCRDRAVESRPADFLAGVAGSR